MIMASENPRDMAVKAAKLRAIAMCRKDGFIQSAGDESKVSSAIESIIDKLHSGLDLDREGLGIVRKMDPRNPILKLISPVRKLTEEQREVVDAMAWVFCGTQAIRLLFETIGEQHG